MQSETVVQLRVERFSAAFPLESSEITCFFLGVDCVIFEMRKHLGRT